MCKSPDYFIVAEVLQYYRTHTARRITTCCLLERGFRHYYY